MAMFLLAASPGPGVFAHSGQGAGQWFFPCCCSYQRVASSRHPRGLLSGIQEVVTG
ncbi:MAG: hypothetical protein K9K37_05200 [Desulfocapsa sp.]|nr:hypothetical protein [Desulfocapsa sp.]